MVTGHGGLTPWQPEEEEEVDPDADIDIEHYTGKTSAWVANPPVANKVGGDGLKVLLLWDVMECINGGWTWSSWVL